MLQRLAHTGAGFPPAPPGRWAAGPAQLAGEGGQLVEVLDRVPTGRLVILGEPGAGKTMLAVRLVLDLLARRPSGAPVPLLVPLASWNPGQQDLHGWLEDRLVLDHPGLTLPAADGSARSRARALLDAGLIWPVLGGLDEISDAVRGPALGKLNDALRPGRRLVLTSRTGPYQAAVHPPSGVEVLLAGAAGIQLRSLDAAAVTDYLGGPLVSPTRHRWQPVLATLTTHPPPPVAQALGTPLMVGLAKTIYHPRPDEHTAALPNPAELLDSDRFPDPTAVEQHLFDGFIPAAYRPHPDPKRTSRWPAAQAERWLVFLAHHLQHRLHTTDLRWWEIPRATPAWVRLSVGLAYGLAGGLTAGLARAMWPSFAIARGWLAIRGRLPWALMVFLADAYQQRGVLRQVGAVYQFRHAELQRRLAARP